MREHVTDTMHMCKTDLHVVVSEGLGVVSGVREPAEGGFHLVAASPDGQRWVRVQAPRLVGDLCPHLPEQPIFIFKATFTRYCIAMIQSVRSERLQDTCSKHASCQEAKSTPAGQL